MTAEKTPLGLAMQCVAEPLSRSIDDIEKAGEIMLDLMLENGALRAFIRRLTNPEDLGHAVTPEVRQLAASVLRGKKPIKAAPKTQGSTMETFAQPKITGYRQLSEEEAAMMNKIKDLAIQAGELVKELETINGVSISVDARWINIGKTDLQKGFMALTRAVAQPTTF